MTEYLLGKRKVECHKYSRPNDSMETHDFLSYYMNIGRPVFFIIAVVIRTVTESSNIVCKCVNPYIDNVLVIECYGNAPVEGCTAYT